MADDQPLSEETPPLYLHEEQKLQREHEERKLRERQLEREHEERQLLTREREREHQDRERELEREREERQLYVRLLNQLISNADLKRRMYKYCERVGGQAKLTNVMERLGADSIQDIEDILAEQGVPRTLHCPGMVLEDVTYSLHRRRGFSASRSSSAGPAVRRPAASDLQRVPQQAARGGSGPGCNTSSTTLLWNARRRGM